MFRIGEVRYSQLLKMCWTLKSAVSTFRLHLLPMSFLLFHIVFVSRPYLKTCWRIGFFFRRILHLSSPFMQCPASNQNTSLTTSTAEHNSSNFAGILFSYTKLYTTLDYSHQREYPPTPAQRYCASTYFNLCTFNRQSLLNEKQYTTLHDLILSLRHRPRVIALTEMLTSSSDTLSPLAPCKAVGCSLNFQQNVHYI